MKTCKRLYGMITIIFLGTAFYGFAGPSGEAMPPPPPDDGMMGPPPDGEPHGDELNGPERMAQKLGLSADQLTKLRAVKQKYVGDLKTKREALKAAHDKLREAMGSDKSVDDIKALHETIKSLQSDMADLHFKIMLETRELLTPEQRVKFANFAQKQMPTQKHKGRHEKDEAPPPAVVQPAP